MNPSAKANSTGQDTSKPAQWDWPFMIYTGMQWFGYTEAEVWRLTPKKLHALMNVYYAVQQANTTPVSGIQTSTKDKQEMRIDQIPGW